MDTKSWMQPGAEPELSKGSSQAKMILGGRFLQVEFQGTMMGMPFEGLQIFGYDNYEKKYKVFWIDNSGTGFYYLSGSLSKDKKILACSGIWPDVITGGESKVRDTTAILNPDEYLYELYMTGNDGKEFKVLEYRAKRK